MCKTSYKIIWKKSSSVLQTHINLSVFSPILYKNETSPMLRYRLSDFKNASAIGYPKRRKFNTSRLKIRGVFEYTANVYSQITFTLLWKLARNTKGICKCQVRQYMSKKYADLEQKLLKSKSSLLVLQVILRNHGT